MVPHQLVRTSCPSDRLYGFVALGNGSSTLAAYRTTGPGVPSGAADFALARALPAGGAIVSVDSAYDGDHTIAVLVYRQSSGSFVLDAYLFDTATDTFGTPQTLANDLHTLNTGDLYTGTSGISAMFDQADRLHLAYWNSGGHVVYRSYSSNQVSLSALAGPTTLDQQSGVAEHPSLAVSPQGDSLTVAWVRRESPTNPTTGHILARTADLATGTFGAVEAVSDPGVDAWTSDFFGTDVDQGPSMVIAADGTRHIVYIEDYDETDDYGRVHHASRPAGGTTWSDEALPAFWSHDPALAITSSGRLLVFGHGRVSPLSPSCPSNDDMCYSERVGATWGTPRVLATPASGQSFDASPSIKWSAVGFNRPELVELLFFAVQNGDYYNPTLYYAHLD